MDQISQEKQTVTLCWFVNDKDRLHFKLKSLEMEENNDVSILFVAAYLLFFETGMYCSHYRPHSLVRRALFNK